MIRRLNFIFIAALNHLLPKRDQVVLHAFPDIEDQVVGCLRALANRRKRPPVFLLISAEPTASTRAVLRILVGNIADDVVILRKNRPAAIWAYLRARYVFFTHGLYGFLPVPPWQVVVNLWHGMPLKRIWRGLPGSHVPQCTWLLSTSPLFSKILAEASGLPATKLIASGLPRNDLLFAPAPAAKRLGAQLRAGASRLLLFLPTYRASARGFATSDGIEPDSVLGMNPGEIAEFCRLLAQHHIRVLVKPHPMSAHHGKCEMLNENLQVISDEWLLQRGATLYEILGQVDALVTDISSVCVDFLALRKPIFFYFPDFGPYRRTRTFQLEPIEQWLAGPLCQSAAELTEVLRLFAEGRDDYADRRQQLAEQLNPQDGAVAASRLLDCLLDQ